MKIIKGIKLSEICFIALVAENYHRNSIVVEAIPKKDFIDIIDKIQ